jgi:hypothetical protein
MVEIMVKEPNEFEKWCRDHIKYTVKWMYVDPEIARKDQELLEKKFRNPQSGPRK